MSGLLIPTLGHTHSHYVNGVCSRDIELSEYSVSPCCKGRILQKKIKKNKQKQ